MIEIKKKDNNSCFLEYKGTVEDRFRLLRILASLNCKRINENKWIVPMNIPQDILESLYKTFELNMVTSPWKDVGKGLKYEPYEYQKETVFFGSEKNSALFLLPTGSGKI